MEGTDGVADGVREADEAGRRGGSWGRRRAVAPWGRWGGGVGEGEQERLAWGGSAGRSGEEIVAALGRGGSTVRCGVGR